MTRSVVERAVREFYRRRLTNELEPCLQCFAPDAVFRLAGTPRAGGVCVQVQCDSGVRAVFETLTGAWKWSSQVIESLIVEGSKVAVRFRLTAAYVPTGETIETEIMDDIELDTNLKIASFVEFVDTAEAARLGAK